jgi:hypothetical protein
MAWSADGKRLAIYQRSQTAWDSGRVFVVNRNGELVRPTRELRLYNVRSLLWMGNTLVLPALNVDVSHVKPWYESGITADSCVVSFLPPDGGMVRSVVHARFWMYVKWASSGPYLSCIIGRRYLIAECVR